MFLHREIRRAFIPHMPERTETLRAFFHGVYVTATRTWEASTREDPGYDDLDCIEIEGIPADLAEWIIGKHEDEIIEKLRKL